MTEAIYVNVVVGIGAGVLRGAELYRGASGAAGEVGYLPLPDPEERQ
jgi:predicted NBD/HSP70 family sugar kinase